MHIVVSKDFREFIAGVFSEKENANELSSQISKLEYMKILYVELEYPFYITEDHSGFSFYSEREVNILIGGYIEDMGNHDEEWCYTNLYRVESDLKPKIPGKDYMGLMPHHHIDNDTLSEIKDNGFDSLWIR